VADVGDVALDDDLAAARAFDGADVLEAFSLAVGHCADSPCSGHYNLRMAIEVAKVELKSVQDASGLEERIREKQFAADEVVAVIGKTEGNGGGNDFTRILVDQAFR